MFSGEKNILRFPIQYYRNNFPEELGSSEGIPPGNIPILPLLGNPQLVW